MNPVQGTKRFFEIFCPREQQRLNETEAGARLVSYTGAETAKSIIENQDCDRYR